MSRLIVFVVVGGLVVVSSALAPRAVAAPVPTHLMPKEPPCAYPLTVGTTWVYETDAGTDVTIAIAKVETKESEKIITTEWVHAEGKRTPHMVLAVSDKGVFLVAEGGSTYSKPWCIWKLPYAANETWATG